MNNNYNNQPMGGVANQNANYSQPQTNYGPQPMPNQGINYGQPNNMNQGYGYNYQPKPEFKFPPISKEKYSIVGYVGALIMLIGSFLNFASIRVALGDYEILNESINYFSNDGDLKDGAFIFIAAIAALLLVHFRKNIFSLIPTGIAGLILFADIADLNERISTLKGMYGSSSYLTYDVSTSYGPASFVIAVGIIALIVHVVMMKMEQKKVMPSNMMNAMPQPMNNQSMSYNQPMSGMANQNANYGQPQTNYGPQPMPNQGMNYNQNNQYPQNNPYPNNNMMS